jgi:hypothetical protein
MFSQPINTPYVTENQKKISQLISDNQEPETKFKPKFTPQTTEPTTKNPTPYSGYKSPPPSKEGLDAPTTYQGSMKKKEIADKMADVMVDKEARLPIQPIALTSPFIPPQFSSYLNSFMQKFYTPMIYKDYHINIGGPNADHVTASLIYEDAIPQNDVYMSYKSLKERNNLVDYVRSSFIRITEGEYIDFQGDESSLNSRLNLIQLNPFDTNIHGGGPYKGLAKGFLIYSSCWPIMYNKEKSTPLCQKNSVGLIVRIYQLNQDSLVARFPKVLDKTIKSDVVTAKLSGDLLNVDNYDQWREVKYYEFIRDKICKAMVNPNFIQSYCYFLNTDTKFDFTKIGSSVQPAYNPEICKTALVLLAESPNLNLLSWTSNMRTRNHNIITQTYAGFKPKENWETVIFQMLTTFYIMDKNNFTFTDMNINNFFVKDVNIFGDSPNQSWLYKINRIDYYVPCKGDLLLVDHDYHDIKSDEFKIIGKMFNDDEKLIKEKIRTNAIQCISENNFGNLATSNMGVVKPPSDIIQLLVKLNADLSARDENNEYLYTFEQIIQNNFIKFVHNRVGTSIRENEKDYIRKNDVRPFIKGEMVIYESKFETYEIVLYLESVDEYTCKCVSKEKNEVIIKNCNKDLIYHYSDNEIIRQDTLPGVPSLSMDYIIETYNM